MYIFERNHYSWYVTDNMHFIFSYLDYITHKPVETENIAAFIRVVDTLSDFRFTLNKEVNAFSAIQVP